MSFSASVTFLNCGQPGLWRCSNPATRPGALSCLLLPLHEPLHGQLGTVPLYLHPPRSVSRSPMASPCASPLPLSFGRGPRPWPLPLMPLLPLFYLPSSQWPLCCSGCHRWGHLPPPKERVSGCCVLLLGPCLRAPPSPKERVSGCCVLLLGPCLRAPPSPKERVSGCCVLLLGPCSSTVFCPSCGGHILKFWVHGLMYTPEVSSSGFSPFINIYICSVPSNRIIPILTFSYLHVDPVSSWYLLSSA